MCPPGDLQSVRISREEVFLVLQASVAQDLTLSSPSERPGCVQSLALQGTCLLGNDLGRTGFSRMVLKANGGHDR